jgi:predicted phage terminase large subunit-like protein
LNAQSYSQEEIQSGWNTLAREDYSFYVEYTHRGLYMPAKHTHLICKKLEEVERGECTRLILCLPPRHSKSMTVSETFPSWFMGKQPNRRVIEVSYGSSLAQRFGRANKKKIDEFGEDIFGITLSKDNASGTNFGIAGYRGGMISAGIGGSITGEGADLLLVDDPIRNRSEALSAAYKERLWNEWTNTLLTRLHPGGRVIIILTRWSEDDLVGRILDEEAEKWDVISLPAECEEDGDLLDRKVGEALWPERGYGKEWLEQTKKEVGSVVWNALYQQHPTPLEGGLIKRDWFKYYNALPNHFDEVIQSWDCTFKDVSTSDFVVGQVWGRIGADKYLIDMVRDRMGIVGTIQAIRNLSAKYPESMTKLIEDKANGTAVIEMLKKEIPGIIPVNPEGGKMARLQAVSPQIEAGNVYIPSPSLSPWVHDFVEEVVSFPNFKFDDIVDSMSQALYRFEKAGAIFIGRA